MKEDNNLDNKELMNNNSEEEEDEDEFNYYTNKDIAKAVIKDRYGSFKNCLNSFSQLDNVYGKEVAQIILDNCGLTYLKTNTQETAEAISETDSSVPEKTGLSSMKGMDYETALTFCAGDEDLLRELND